MKYWKGDLLKRFIKISQVSTFLISIVLRVWFIDFVGLPRRTNLAENSIHFFVHFLFFFFKEYSYVKACLFVCLPWTFCYVYLKNLTFVTLSIVVASLRCTKTTLLLRKSLKFFSLILFRTLACKVFFYVFVLLIQYLCILDIRFAPLHKSNSPSKAGREKSEIVLLITEKESWGIISCFILNADGEVTWVKRLHDNGWILISLIAAFGRTWNPYGHL